MVAPEGASRGLRCKAHPESATDKWFYKNPAQTVRTALAEGLLDMIR